MTFFNKINELLILALNMYRPSEQIPTDLYVVKGAKPLLHEHSYYCETIIKAWNKIFHDFWIKIFCLLLIADCYRLLIFLQKLRTLMQFFQFFNCSFQCMPHTLIKNIIIHKHFTSIAGPLFTFMLFEIFCLQKRQLTTHRLSDWHFVGLP